MKQEMKCFRGKDGELLPVRESSLLVNRGWTEGIVFLSANAKISARKKSPLADLKNMNTYLYRSHRNCL